MIKRACIVIFCSMAVSALWGVLMGLTVPEPYSFYLSFLGGVCIGGGGMIWGMTSGYIGL